MQFSLHERLNDTFNGVNFTNSPN